MEVQIFKDITTEDILVDLEKLAEDYTGLYVEMGDPEQRKYVKEKAQTITDMLKTLDRARIDKSKAFKSSVEAEALEIKKRLEKANEPFTLLIDEHKAERKKILDAKKAKEEAIEAAKQLELDHELGLLMNTQWGNDKEKREAEKAAEVERIAENARQELIVEQQRQADYQASIDKSAKEESERLENLRVRDVEHRRAVNQVSVNELELLGVTNDRAIAIVKALANNKLTHITINY